MTKSIRYIVALSLAVATVLCAKLSQPSKEDLVEQALKSFFQQIRDQERTPREMWRQ
jgi:hypothetical protein